MSGPEPINGRQQDPRESRSAELKSRFLDRADLAGTIILDAILLAIAVGARAGLLWITRRLSAPGEHDIVIRLLEFVMDFGIIGTTVVIVIFDLAKRIKQALQDLFR
jgi:hypothetical protein